MRICVLSRTGRGGKDDPQAFHLGTHRLPVVAVLGQWTEAEHRYFKVRVEDGRRFVLRHDPARLGATGRLRRRAGIRR